MPIVNFNINPALDKKIKKFIKKEGFSSKAEFFRFSAMQLMDEKDEPIVLTERTKVLLDELKEVVREKYGGKKLPPLEEQLRDL